MVCLSPTAAENRLEAPAASAAWGALHGWRSLWLRSGAQWRARRDTARLDDRTLRDLGIQRDAIEQRDLRDLGQLWLSHPAL